MKTDIHPNYQDSKIKCACGASFKAGSTAKEIKIEVCSACHPFYTGKQDHMIDTTGRVDKFKAKMAKAKKYRTDMGIEEKTIEVAEKKEEATTTEVKEEVATEKEAA